MLKKAGEKDSTTDPTDIESTVLMANANHDVAVQADGIAGIEADESQKSELERKEACDLESLRQTTIVVCLVILAMLGVAYTMYFGKAIFMPIVFALLFNFIFSPTVISLRKRGVPSAIGALLLMGAGMVLIVGLFWMLFVPARSWLEKAPENISKIERKVSQIVKPFNTLRETTEKVDQLVDGSATLAGEDSEKGSDEKKKVPGEATSGEATSGEATSGEATSGEATSGEESAEAVPLKFGKPATDGDGTAKSDIQSDANLVKEPPVKVQLERPSLTGFVLSATGDALLGVGLAFVLLFYLLAAGERGLEKMVELMPTFKDKKRIVGLTRDIQDSIIQYLRTTALINIGLGIVIGVGLWLIGMPNPLLWGVMACLLNFFPMIGACIGSAIVFVVALVTFDSISFALAAPAIYGGVNLIEANFVTPSLLGRSVSLHPVWLMVFFTIVTWLWGVGGAILAVPMLAIIKISCDHSDVFQPVGKFLGR